MRELHERLTAEDERPDLRLVLRAELAASAAAPVALAELDAVVREARQLGHLGTVRAAHVGAAAVAAAVNTERARQEALAALALADAGCRDTLRLPADLWLHAGRALAAADDGRAGQVLARGRQWVLDTAQHHVPEPFRDSFLQRNPANRELLSLAARVAAS